MTSSRSSRPRLFHVAVAATSLAGGLAWSPARAADSEEAKWNMPGSVRARPDDPSHLLLRTGGPEVVKDVMRRYRPLIAEIMGGKAVVDGSGRDKEGRSTATVSCKFEVAGAPATCGTVVAVSTTDEAGRIAAREEARRAVGPAMASQVEMLPEPLLMMKQFIAEPGSPAARGGTAGSASKPGHTMAEWKSLAETYGWLYQAHYQQAGDVSEGAKVLDRCKKDWAAEGKTPGGLSHEDRTGEGGAQEEERELSDQEAMALASKLAGEMSQARFGTGSGKERSGWDFWFDCLKRLERAAYRTEIHIQGVFAPR